MSEPTKKSLEDQRYLSFHLGAEQYAVPLLKVKEVIAPPEITPLPFTPNYFLGIMNLRGQIISVIDLRSKFNIKAGNTSETAIIIYDLRENSLGLMVDSINAVLSIPLAEISIDATFADNSKLEYIKGVYSHGDSMIVLLDTEKVLNFGDKAVIQKQNGAAKNAA